jgi:hypothetical protein
MEFTGILTHLGLEGYNRLNHAATQTVIKCAEDGNGWCEQNQCHFDRDAKGPCCDSKQGFLSHPCIDCKPHKEGGDAIIEHAEHVDAMKPLGQDQEWEQIWRRMNLPIAGNDDDQSRQVDRREDNLS